MRSLLCAGTLPAQWLSGISGLAVNISLLDLSFNKLTGSIPAEAGGKFLARNRSDGIAAAVILDPMSSPFSMCGPIPEKMHVVSAIGGPLNHTMPGVQCPGGCLSAQVTDTWILENCGNSQSLQLWSPIARLGVTIRAVEVRAVLFLTNECIFDAYAVVSTGGKRTTVIASAVAACAAVAVLLAVTLVTWQVRKRRALSTKLSYSALLKLQADPKNGLKVEFDNVGNPRLLGKGGFGEVRTPFLPKNFDNLATSQVIRLKLTFGSYHLHILPSVAHNNWDDPLMGVQCIYYACACCNAGVQSSLEWRSCCREGPNRRGPCRNGSFPARDCSS